MDDHDLPVLADVLEPDPEALATILEAMESHGQPPAEAIYHPGTGERMNREPWPGITNDDLAEWALAKLAQVDAAITERHAHAEAMRAQIDGWLHDQLERGHGGWPSLMQQRAFFTSHLEAYAREQRETKDRKTVALVAGEVATRTQKARVVIENEALLLKWCEEHGADALVRVRRDVLVSTLAEHTALVPIAADSEAVEAVVTFPDADGVQRVFKDVPGVAVEPEHVTVTVKPR